MIINFSRYKNKHHFIHLIKNYFIFKGFIFDNFNLQGYYINDLYIELKILNRDFSHQL